MNNNTGKTIWIVVIVLVLIGIIAAVVHSNRYATPVAVSTTSTSTDTGATPTTVSYSCDSGKTITAVYGDTTANLTLSDGRSLALTQGMSGSGVSYVDATGAINFRTEGSNGFLQENGTTTYNNCVSGTTAVSTNGMTTFTDQGNTFSFMYPAGVTVAGGGVGYTTDWLTNNVDQTSGMILAKASIDQSTQPKTNFAGATLTVSTSSDPKAVTDCLKAQNGDTLAAASVTINGVTYAKLTGSDAGAGNLYDTTSYRTVRNSQCYAVEYTIHSTPLGTYDPSQGVTAFDAASVKSTLEGMVQSLKFL